MKQFKIIFTVGIFVLAFVGAMIIQNALPPRTVDFRGEVHKVVISEGGTVTLMAISAHGGEFLFRIDEKSVLRNDSGESITVDDLKEGALIDINYREYLFRQEDTHTVQTLKVYSK